jgi:hypothetical protein
MPELIHRQAWPAPQESRVWGRRDPVSQGETFLSSDSILCVAILFRPRLDGSRQAAGWDGLGGHISPNVALEARP